MSTLLVQSGTFDDIADAIRAKTGKVASMTPLEMPEEIASISGGGEVVIDDIIPRMTSNTTPKGTCSASYVYPNRYAYYGFTTSANGSLGDATQFWYAGNTPDQWIQYEFEEAVTIFHILFGTVEGANGRRFKFQFSIDGTNWVDDETRATASNNYTTYDLSTPVYCKYLRIYCIDAFTVISGIRATGIVGQYNPSVTKKKNYVISQNINPTTLVEYVIDENDTINYVNAATYNSYANAFETDLIKYFYDTTTQYHQYYWHVIAKTDVIYNGTNYSAGDTVDYWYYNVQKNLVIEEA